jgi:hypothetical protein
MTGLVAFFCAGYFAIGLSGDPYQAHSLRTSLDDRIPFIAESVFVYAAVYVAALFPLFVVRCPRLLRRVALAYTIAMGVAFVCFMVFPVTSVHLRPNIGVWQPDRFTVWGLKTLYALDPPMNLFPSLHLAIALLAALSSWKARVVYWGIPFVAVGAISASICTVKQHFWVDGAAGIALAGAAYALILRSHDTDGQRREELAYTWRGPAAYLVLLISLYLGCYVAFRGDLRPWE